MGFLRFPSTPFAWNFLGSSDELKQVAVCWNPRQFYIHLLCQFRTMGWAAGLDWLAGNLIQHSSMHKFGNPSEHWSVSYSSCSPENRNWSEGKNVSTERKSLNAFCVAHPPLVSLKSVVSIEFTLEIYSISPSHFCCVFVYFKSKLGFEVLVRWRDVDDQYTGEDKYLMELRGLHVRPLL